MGFKAQFAKQQSSAAHVRFRSKQTSAHVGVMSALPPKADISCCLSDVRYVSQTTGAFCQSSMQMNLFSLCLDRLEFNDFDSGPDNR